MILITKEAHGLQLEPAKAFRLNHPILATNSINMSLLTWPSVLTETTIPSYGPL